MLRLALVLILIVAIARAFWRIVDGIVERVSGRPRAGRAQSGGRMARVPACGTVVLPDRAVLAEVLTTLGSIPIAAYATPSTRELPEAVAKYIKAHDGMLLANHGALTVGPDLFSAYYKMETIEHFAKISLVARLLGRENLISREEVVRLQELRGTYGIKAAAPICAPGGIAAPAEE